MTHTKSETEPTAADLGDVSRSGCRLHRVRQVDRLDRRPKRDGLSDVRERAAQRQVASNARARQPREAPSLSLSREFKNCCSLVRRTDYGQRGKLVDR